MIENSQKFLKSIMSIVFRMHFLLFILGLLDIMYWMDENFIYLVCQ